MGVGQLEVANALFLTTIQEHTVRSLPIAL
jgi:hypothetical protein